MTTYVFTSATLAYLPKVRVLAETVKAHSPKVHFCLLLGELRPLSRPIAAPEIDEVVTLDELGIADLKRWVFQHSLIELCTAIKGLFLKQLLARPNCGAVFYFDPDIVLFGAIEEMVRRFDDGPILLTPHLIVPETSLTAILDNEVAVLKHGLFNLGFLAVLPSPEGRAFAEWWWTRLKDSCRSDIAGGLFTDQRWIDLVPIFFEGTVIVRDTAWNVATWNLGQRRVSGTLESGLLVDGRPLVFFHFSGIDSGAQLAMLKKYGRGIEGLFELRDWYLERCHQLSAGDGFETTWSLDVFDDGAPITAAHRHLYRQRPDLQTTFPDPFATSDPDRCYHLWFDTHGDGVKVAGEEETAQLLATYRMELERIRASRSWRAIDRLRGLLGAPRW